jgi:hypothetical protein
VLVAATGAFNGNGLAHSRLASTAHRAETELLTTLRLPFPSTSRMRQSRT